VRSAVLVTGHSSGGGDRDLLVLLKGKVFEGLVEALVVGIPLFYCFRLALLFTFVILIIKLPSGGRENPVCHWGD
jgi:hypothetical protein